MKKPSPPSDNEKWQAVVSCDKGYDGIFFYGVKTTGIFCRPQCRAKTPVRANVVFFDNAVDAMEAGFRPCKKCLPDQVSFEPNLELVKKAKEVFNVNFDRPIALNIVSKQLGVSINHLTRLFKQYCGLTPNQYITKLRIEKATQMLTREDLNIIEIAYMTGFKSLSNFYKCFKEHTGNTPNEYRKTRA